jgi:hypothetical protein
MVILSGCESGSSLGDGGDIFIGIEQ